MGRPVVGGSTNQSTVVRIIDACAGTPEQAVNACTAGLNLWYRKGPLGTVANLTESTLAGPCAAHSDGGLIHLDDGYYRVDLPDAAWSTCSCETCVTIGGTATGMIVIGENHPLVDYNLCTVQTNVASILTDTGTSGVVLANCAITAAKIAANAIGSSELAACAITSCQIAAGAITSTVFAACSIPAGAIALAERNNIADALLNRNLACVTVTNTRSPINALRFLRNKWGIVGGTLTVYQENDTTSAWTAAVTTAAGNPVNVVDPA